MQAVVYEQFGEPGSVLKLRDVPLPTPGHGEVRVRMLASPVNPSDLLTVRGIYPMLPQLPAVPGFEGVGVVEAHGGGLWGRLMLGKRVAVLNRTNGNWCEQTIISARQVVPLPNDIPLEQAAMFFVNPATAYTMTRTILAVPRGQWLLQTAAGSAVGRMVIRLGRRYGFRTLNVVRRAEQVAELKSLGADAVLVCNADRGEMNSLRDRVREAISDDAVRYAIDPVGGATASAVATTLADGGRLLLYGTMTNEPISFSSRVLMTGGASVEGFWLARWITLQSLVGRLKLVRKITGLLREGVLVSEVGQTFPLTQIADAVRHAETAARAGKVLLRMAG